MRTAGFGVAIEIQNSAEGTLPGSFRWIGQCDRGHRDSFRQNLV
jgi:hypothetical protein